MKFNWSFILIPVLVIFWLVNVSRPGTRVEGCLSGCSIKRERLDNSLHVISFNMLHGYPKFDLLAERVEIIIDELEKFDPDIILLQEVPWTIKTGNVAEYIATRIAMNHVYIRANGNRWTIGFEEGEAILSRFPLKNPRFSELNPKAGLFEHRVVLHVISTTSIGEIGIYVTHLTNGDEIVNLKQSESLAKFVSLDNTAFTIVAGDFNAKPSSTQIRAMSSLWVDTFLKVEPENDGFTCCNDDLYQRHSNPDKRIDYLFYSSNEIEPYIESSKQVFSRSYPVDDGWLWASDHLGLEVVFKVDN
jgi:endonuclease/exonuclease/phosphatase family metal-dependent hydrolase